ncbi:MAG: carbohydrate kinase family protein [Devosia sp.]|uniref:carbohydrate kinase family protein n=1 Tax=Devosia sp. TaxID=1871048 RepID=UPI001A3A67C3|nr:carbohydrate kinase family protein [Devosia sp.]MBL8598765.1 carbohydrate kinase family protein [Devosia sp.]
MTEPKVLVVGDTITDIIVMPEGPMVRGSDRRAIIRSKPGGSAANHAVWLGRLGMDVTFVSRVAAVDLDKTGAYFASRNVDARLAADTELPSGVLISIVDSDGERSFLTDRGANLNLSAADLPTSLLDRVKLLVVSGYCLFTEGPRAAVSALLREARERKIATAVDPASVGFLREVGPESFLKWTQGTGTIFANLDEALELTGSVDINLQMQTLGRFYDRVVLKRGVAGAAVGGRKGVALSMPAPLSDVIDTTGAGDAFAAAFLSSELKGQPLEACLKAGIAAGSEAVATIGGQPG